ncbi:MAG: hypothetical protein AAGA56_11700 [Myxococcota bacterium]
MKSHAGREMLDGKEEISGPARSIGTSARASLGVAIVVALTVTGCAASAQSQIETDVYPRAAFDLDCGQDDLRHTVLVDSSNAFGQPMAGMQVGVTGCGRKAIYIHTPTPGWVNNDGGTKVEDR